MIQRAWTFPIMLALAFTTMGALPVAGKGTPLTPVAKKLLQHYAGVAQKEDSSFAGFEATRGRELYFSEHKGKEGKMQSCSTCHMRDPAQPGRSDVGKSLLPLSPAANAKRFMDEEEIEKWFHRNCRGVLGRTCTPREKGDFIAFMFSLK